MKVFLALLALSFVTAGILIGQANSANWPTYGGDAQRSGWEKTDTRITKPNAKDLQLLFKLKLESQAKGSRQLMPPVILGRLISYRGFKELAFVGTNSDIVYAIDADLGKIFWQKHLEYASIDPQATGSSAACPGGMTAIPTMPAPGVTARGGRGAAPAAAGAGAGARGAANAFVGGTTSVYAISSDGRLHRLNTSTGDDMAQPVSVLPANARISTLNMANNVIYAVTSQSCNGAPNALWAIDLNGDAPKATSFALNAGGDLGLGGATLGSDGTVYVHTGVVLTDGSQKWAPTLQALDPLGLQPGMSFSTRYIFDNFSFDPYVNVTSPAIFNYKNRDLIAGSTWDDRLYLLDSTSKEMRDPLYRTPPLGANARAGSGGRGIWGGLSTWQDSDGTRWVLAPIWGPLHPDLKIPGASPTPNGAIVAFKLEESQGKTVLTPAWVSRDMSSPMPPVITNGVVFVLSAGEFGIDERPKGSTHAALYALDAATGKELYSSRNLITSPASLTGITLANGRVYFGTTDSTFYAFGIYQER